MLADSLTESDNGSFKRLSGWGYRKMRVLIVDDQNINRSQIRQILMGEPDMEVHEAASGEQAVEHAMETCPRVVLMDIAMPGMNGIEAATEIKRRLPSTQVIAVTIHDNPEYRKAMFNAGAYAYLMKEDLPDDLVGVVRGAATRAGGSVHEQKETNVVET